MLRRCAKWNMILSIDEADVFLEARSPHSPERNKIVSGEITSNPEYSHPC